MDLKQHIPAQKRKNPKMINKDKMFWVQNYDLNKPMIEFSHEFKQNMGFTYYGIVYLIVYDKKDKDLIHNELNTEIFLEGPLPSKLSEHSVFDFLLTPEKIINLSILIHILGEHMDKCNIVELELVPNGENINILLLNFY